MAKKKIKEEIKSLFEVRIVNNNEDYRIGPALEEPSMGFTGKGIFDIIEVKENPITGMGWGLIRELNGWVRLDHCIIRR